MAQAQEVRLVSKYRKKLSAARAESYVVSLYVNLLERSPDREGLAAHVRHIRQGGDAADVFQSFIDSDEYKQLQQRKGHVSDGTNGRYEIRPFVDVNAKGFDLEMVMAASAKHFSDRRFLDALRHVPSLVGRRKRRVQRIALYYHKLRSGGIERVTAWQATAWTRMGYDVLLITDEKAQPAEDYAYPATLRRVVIPAKHMWNVHGEYTERGYALADALRSFEADLFVTNLGNEICSSWDMLVAKSLGIPVVLGWHNVFDADFHDGQGLDAAQIRLLTHRYADLTTVLTSMDQAWFTLNGYSARLVPNPPSFEFPKEAAALTGKSLVWVARVDRHQKRVDHVLQMMPLVLTEHPDAVLTIVGTGPELAFARELARDLGIASYVRFAGYTEDVRPYLEKAALNVMTSEFEGFGLALEEAWSFGVPSVLYQMPYLELLKPGKGHVAVPQGDIRALARAVNDLLADRPRRARLGAEARAVSRDFRRHSPEDAWRQVFADIATRDRLGPTIEDLAISRDVQEMLRLLSEKLFPPHIPLQGLPVPREPVEPKLQKARAIREAVTDRLDRWLGRGFKPLRMIDCTAIPLGDSFMFFSGLHAMLVNGLQVCAPDCTLHTHKPMVDICRVIFADLGITVVEGPPVKVQHPFYYPHPPVSNEDWKRTYLGADWRMDWVESTDRQKTIGRPGYRDTLRKMVQLAISERLIYGRGGGWKTATPSYIGFRVWWPIALKLGVYPVVFYSMVSRSLGDIRERLHTYLDTLIEADCARGLEPFTGNAFFPTGNSYQTIDPATCQYIIDEVGGGALTVFVQDDSPWRPDFMAAGIATRHSPSIIDTLKLIRTARSVVTCCSFTSHVAQFLRDDFVLVMFKDLPENNVNPGANPKMVTYNPPCSPCNYLPRGQYKSCPAGYPYCIALDNVSFREKIVRDVKALIKAAD